MAAPMLMLFALVAAELPPTVVTPGDIVLEATFDAPHARASDRDQPLAGQMLGAGELAGGALRLEGAARLRFDGPTSIDLRRGATTMDLSLHHDAAAAPQPLAVLWCLQGTGAPRYMARLYITTAQPQLVFGVYQRDEGTWLYLLKAPIQWKAGETHRVTVTWGEKTSLIVDGRIVSVVRSEGLLTDAMLPASIDLRDARLFIGTENARLTSDITVSRFVIRNQTFRFAGQEMD